MIAVRFWKKIETSIPTLPELDPLVGKTVEMIVLEDEDAALCEADDLSSSHKPAPPQAVSPPPAVSAVEPPAVSAVEPPAVSHVEPPFGSIVVNTTEPGAPGAVPPEEPRPALSATTSFKALFGPWPVNDEVPDGL